VQRPLALTLKFNGLVSAEDPVSWWASPRRTGPQAVHGACGVRRQRAGAQAMSTKTTNRPWISD